MLKDNLRLTSVFEDYPTASKILRGHSTELTKTLSKTVKANFEWLPRVSYSEISLSLNKYLSMFAI